MSSPTTLNDIRQQIALYGLSTLLVLGNFGNIFTIIILGRNIKRQPNSCSLYLLSACISNWIVINTALISNIVGVDHIDPQNTSNVVCKLRWAGTHALLMLSRSFMIAGCIDRWALCSQSATIRLFSRPRIAIRVIIILIIIWTIIPVHLAIFYNNDTGRCIALSDTYAFFYAIYSLIVIGILPLFLMILFSLLAWHNLQSIRFRVAPTDGTTRRSIHIHKRDRDLMKMLSGEVFVYCLTTIPYPINLIYSVSTSSIAAYKSPMRLAIESLIGYIVSPLLNFMYCCAQFYVYAFSSAKFRKEFINLICLKPMQNDVTINHMTRSMTYSKRQHIDLHDILLAWHNLQSIRFRVTPLDDKRRRSIYIHKRDRNLMKMLSGEVFVYCLTTIPYPINLIYSVSTSSIAAYKSLMRLAIESLIGYIVSPLPNYAACCKKFRKHFLDLFHLYVRDAYLP